MAEYIDNGVDVVSINERISFKDIKSMLRKYRDNLRITLDTLWDEFAVIGLEKEKKA